MGKLTVGEKTVLFLQMYKQRDLSFEAFTKDMAEGGLGLYVLYDEDHDKDVTNLWLPESVAKHYNECAAELNLGWSFIPITTLSDEHQALVEKVEEFYGNNQKANDQQSN